MEKSRKLTNLLKLEKLSDMVTNDIEIENQVNNIFEFLSLVHPTSLEGGFQRPIEIRFLERTETGTNGLHSGNLFGLSQKSKENLIEKVKMYKDKSICMYYSGFQYDYSYTCELKRTKRNGERYTLDGKPQKIRKESVIGTQELPADFDKLTFEEFSVYNNILKSVGIESVVVFTGHGYQSHVLLDKYCTDPTIFEKFTSKLSELGFKVDTSIKDPSRVLRLPFTVNFKEFDRKQYPLHPPQAIETKLIEITEKRYSLEFVFEKLDELIGKRKESMYKEDSKALDEFFDIWAPEREKDGLTVSTIPTKNVEKNAAGQPIEKQKQPKEQKLKVNTEHAIQDESYFEDLYDYLDFKNLKSQIKLILMGVDEGIRNDALLFLLPFLRNELRLSLKEVKETLVTWGENCNPSYFSSFMETEVDRLWKYDNQATFGRYTDGLEQVYGKLDIGHVIDSDRHIVVENRMFNVINKLDGAALKVYLTIKLLEKEEDRLAFKNDEIIERAEISLATFKRGMKSLVLTKLVNKKVLGINTKTGGKYLYSINTLGSEVYGYTQIETATIELLISKNLSKLEIAFYIFMRSKVWSSEKQILFMSRENIAHAIGSSSETTISKVTDKLSKLKFIRKKVEKHGLKKICKYTLLK